jgi:hypothetical protein
MMERVEVDELQLDPLAAALIESDKDTVTVTGYVCAADDATISLSDSRGSSVYIEYPRTAVVAAFTDEESGQATLLIESSARVREISTTRAGVSSAQARSIGGAGCGTTCTSRDGSASCCCGLGQRCRSLLSTCICEDASRPFAPGDVGSGSIGAIARPASTFDVEGSVNWPSSPPSAEEREPGGPSTVPSGYGRRCRRVPYWVCVGNRCWVDYAWECVYYPLPRAQFA